jgi:putative transposase
MVSCIAKSTEPLNIRWSRPLEGKHSSITIANKTGSIDLGLTDFLVTSDGEKVKHLKALIKYQKKLARAQKRLSKKLNGSNNAKEARLKVARLHN